MNFKFGLYIGYELPKNVSLPAPGSLHIQFPPQLEPLTPLDIVIEPYFVHHHQVQHQPRPNAQSGRLLTPAEGCGVSQGGMRGPRILGGSPAAIGAWPWMVCYCKSTNKVYKSN